MASPFTIAVKTLIKKIPEGKVCTYGVIAILAGNPRAARQVAWILHSSTRKDGLPWHRVVNRHGKISLQPDQGYGLQKQLLTEEGVEFGPGDTICLKSFLWMPDDEAGRR